MAFFFDVAVVSDFDAPWRIAKPHALRHHTRAKLNSRECWVALSVSLELEVPWRSAAYVLQRCSFALDRLASTQTQAKRQLRRIDRVAEGFASTAVTANRGGGVYKCSELSLSTSLSKYKYLSISIAIERER